MLNIGNSDDPLVKLRETIDNLRYLKALPPGAHVAFSNCGYAKPVSVTPLALVGHVKGLTFSNTSSYVERMSFPNGEEISLITDFLQKMNLVHNIGVPVFVIP